MDRLHSPYEEKSMGCRIGMSTNVNARVAELVQAGLVPSHAKYRTLKTGLTYDEANGHEVSERAICGPACQGNPGGQYVAGRVWNVYRLDW